MSSHSGGKKRDSPISAEDISDARPWRLPFWTEPPVHVVKREAEEDAKAEAKKNLDAASDQSKTNNSAGSYPTADELETIRREAYNDGLEQGRVEGRQQGHKDGYDDGLAEGKAEGHKDGFASGKQEGINAGFAEGRANGVDDVTAEVTRLRAIIVSLQSSLRERDAQLPDVIVLLLTRLAEQVLRHELSGGAQAIQTYVDDAIASLPDGEELARVYVAAEDAELLSPFSETVKVHIDKSLSAGDCRIESQTSLIEYTTSEHFEQAILHLAERLLSNADGYPNDDEIAEATKLRESDIEDDASSEALENEALEYKHEHEHATLKHVSEGADAVSENNSGNNSGNNSESTEALKDSGDSDLETSELQDVEPDDQINVGNTTNEVSSMGEASDYSDDAKLISNEDDSNEPQ